MHSPVRNRKIVTPVTPERIVEAIKSPKRSPFVSSSPKSKNADEIKEVYQLIQKATGSIGGNADGSAIYGEISECSMQKVLTTMQNFCEMDKSSAMVDIGSGLGKPNFHAAQEKIRISFGVELVTIRHELCMQNLTRVVKSASESVNVSGLNFINADITKAKSLNPFTHVYQFDLGFEPPLHHYISRMFNNSASCQYLISYRRPREILNYGYKVTHLPDLDLSTSMSGSGEHHTCYFYVKSKEVSITDSMTKRNLNKILLEDPETSSVTSEDDDSIEDVLVEITAPSSDNKKSIKLQSDPLWANLIELSFQKEKLLQYCEDFNATYFKSPRPQRTSCKSPQRYGDYNLPTTPSRTAAKAINASMISNKDVPVAASVTPTRSPVRSPKKAVKEESDAALLTPPRSAAKKELKVVTPKSPARSRIINA